ncbi:DUF4240 domain-containing protein [Flavobacterium johnsoniae]|uniref:Hypothetical lipoprotein n=1 Tax=Flavobacterium johnsoniae (strain ATCC 17061 / DSM 2064 / JCM 8514 / BCRC 14874 / CCUG 350202 / NBRC 14942 / NCIMB 11054 / UW101) TaxID=376686 RepID=A5FDP6_FLAJ1|nr:DUF4240 domain-containing protein [Flavobacterium johnsoniae]ABQ06665.1 hypothetical lipoprotein [Flavobacterium johnsoniae UW101]OXE99903.1 hypothetical protein B0A63_11430 [Flavobacterium johnsoniae UW101]WQG82421.1 DUF4240 domain-containing protein [Flavobacterium johnsoniae UW101]SHM00788.1 Protein of unknown function [Flavobacterium johnsoniae]
MKKVKFIVVFLMFTIISCQHTNKNDIEKSNKTVLEFIKSDKMDKDEFWKIIDYSIANSKNDKLEKEKIIVEKLSAYSPEQIIEFEIILRQLIIQADDFKTMAAQKIIEDYVSDDSYIYFRCWLIGKGEEIYKGTIRNPDFLSDRIAQDDDFYFEGLLYVATSAYKIRTGIKEEDESFPRDVAILKGLDYDFVAPPTKGVDWKEEDLPRTYPKLWRLFN